MVAKVNAEVLSSLQVHRAPQQIGKLAFHLRPGKQANPLVQAKSIPDRYSHPSPSPDNLLLII